MPKESAFLVVGRCRAEENMLQELAAHREQVQIRVVVSSLFSWTMNKLKRVQKRKVHKKKRQRHPEDSSLLQRAYKLHKTGQLPEAQQAYEKFLKKSPNHPETLGNLGLLLHSQGEVKQAIELYRQALSRNPRLKHLHYFLGNGYRETGQHAEAIAAYKKALLDEKNKKGTLLQLGKAYTAAGQLDEAAECFEQVLRLRPDHGEALFQLGLLCFQQHRFTHAMDHFSTILFTQPDNVDACFNLALCHKALGQPDQALEFLHRASRLAPQDGDILYNIGVLHKEIGELNQAETFFLQSLEIDPENGICLTDLAILYHIQNRLDQAEVMYQRALNSGYHADSASHMLAALKGETTVETPLEHVRDLFDNFAERFEHSLLNDLQYTIPTQLAGIVQQQNNNNLTVDSAVDLGCGTGLSGLAFRTLTKHLTGVDLSQNMLHKAAQKGLYDDLHCIDIIQYLGSAKHHYDLAVAADVLVYLGQLELFFAAVSCSLNPGGLLLFSTESCSEHYSLRQSGRYAHSQGYIAELADRFHFKIEECRATGIRKERGEWIKGENYLLTYRPSPSGQW